ncbi:MAG: hypothetical protein ABSG84_09820 [Acidobacteriaceae bacterium]
MPLKCATQAPRTLSNLLRAALFAAVCHVAAISAPAAVSSSGVRVPGPGVAPQLIFACCDQGADQMRSLFADPAVIGDLKDLHAGLAVAILDLSPERAQLVRRLNQAGIPTTAWLMLPQGQGPYFNAENAPQAAMRFAAFDAWTRDQGLRWGAVGLDIEPNFAELADLKGHRWRLLTTLLRHAVDRQRLLGAQKAYAALIRTIQSRGYRVQTYQMPFLPAEREAHSTLFDRTLGTVDVRSDEEVLMLYTSFARPAGAAMIWTLGAHAQAIAVGSTDGDATSSPAPLSWDEFSRDLIVAGHFSRTVGVYNLEGCVRQGFLPRLQTFDWSQSVTIPASSLQRANRLHRVLELVLWFDSHLLYLTLILLMAVAWMVWRRSRKGRPSRRLDSPEPS